MITTKNRRFSSAQSGDIGDSQVSQLETIVTVSGQKTITFYWKVSSEQNYDFLEFYIDDVFKDSISGNVDWQQKTYNITGTGSHFLKWQYIKDGSVSSGSDCGWVDYIQWEGYPEPQPPQPPAQSPLPPKNWKTVIYTYDPAGRRITKMVDDWTVKYCYDGDHTIAEYDGENRLLRKYIYGPRVDEPICMVDVADSNAVYYYHFDGLGSVIALSDEDGNTVQTYEYTVYGQVAAEDVNHPNPITFTGRWFDKETGLYYYRARYYNPEIGRFLQTDPVGYGYAYCGNNPIGLVDPSGLTETYVPYAYLYERGNLWYLENVAEPEYNLHWSTWGLSDRFNVAMGGVITTGFTIDGLPLIYIDTSAGPPSYEYVFGLDTCYGREAIRVEDEDLIDYASDLVSDYTPAATTEPAEPSPEPIGKRRGWKYWAGVAIGGAIVGAADGPSPAADIAYWGSAIYAGKKGADITIHFWERSRKAGRGTGVPIPGSEEVHWDHSDGGMRPHKHWLEEHKNPKTGKTSTVRRTGPYHPQR